MPSKEYEQFYQALIAKALPGDQPIEVLRKGFERLMAEFPPPSDIRFEPFTIGSIPVCWAFARNVKRQPIILFFPGGGYTAGSVRSHWGVMARISAASGCAVLGVDYRLAPEHPFPAALEDALTVYRWLLHHPYPHNQIAFAGCSAGGGLLLSLLQRLKLENLALPAAGVCICPWVDLAKRSYANIKDILRPERLISASQMYCRDSDPKNPLISPLYGDLSEMPPLLVQIGTRELLYDENVELTSRMPEAKFDPWPEMFHCWHLFAGAIPEGQKAIDQIGQFIKQAFQ